MTPRQYLAALKELGLTVASQRTAKLLRINVRQSQRYASGHAAIPEPVEQLLQMYAKHGTDEVVREVVCDGKTVEVVQIDGDKWDVMFPWGIERIISASNGLSAAVRARYERATNGR